MNKMITCFLASGEVADLNQTIYELRKSLSVDRIFVLNPGGLHFAGLIPGTGLIPGESFFALRHCMK